MAPHSSTLAWKIPWMEEPGRLQSMGLLRVWHDSETSLSLFTFMHWRRRWQPTPMFLRGESQGRVSLVGCRLWGHTESDTTKVTQQQQQGKLSKVCLLGFLLASLRLWRKEWVFSSGYRDDTILYEGFMTCFRGGAITGRSWGEFSDLPASAVFSFSLKYSICQGAIF